MRAPLSRSELLTTETELKAMAAAAMTGFRNPKSPKMYRNGPMGTPLPPNTK